MISENIKYARKSKRLSQEELAVRLNVVRQTVSKWENGLSVPDADILIQMADVLDVPVSQLLGPEVQENEVQNLTGKLAQLNEELAAYSRQERLTRQANKKRGLILFLSLTALVTALSVKNEIISILLFGGCVLAALIILYRNLALLTSVAMDAAQSKALKATTIFNISVVVILTAIVLLNEASLVTLSEQDGRTLAVVIIAAAMLFFGFVSPKLPFSRHTGLRLPWTVRDEDTWNAAHRILGVIALPIAVLYAAASFTISSFETVTLIALLLYIGIPGGLSLVVYWKKFYKKST